MPHLSFEMWSNCALNRAIANRAGLLTHDIQVECFALAIPLGIVADTRVVTSTRPTHTLQYQALIGYNHSVSHRLAESATLLATTQ